MTDIALPTHAPASLRTMAGIEARRLARHPAFIVGVVAAFGVLILLYVLNDDPHLGDLLSMPVIPAFFIGLPSLVATARLTRSTEATAEAIGTAPGSEARRTAALALACFVPFTAGVALDRAPARAGLRPRGAPVRVVVRHHARLAGVDDPDRARSRGLPRRRPARRTHRTVAALPRRLRGDGGRRRRGRPARPGAVRLPRQLRAPALGAVGDVPLRHRDRRHREPVRRQLRLLPRLRCSASAPLPRSSPSGTTAPPAPADCAERSPASSSSGSLPSRWR